MYSENENENKKESFIASWVGKRFHPKRKKVRVVMSEDLENYVEFYDLQDPALEKFLNHQLFEKEKKERRRR